MEVLKKGKGLYVIPLADVQFSIDKHGYMNLLKNENTAIGIKISPAAITEEDRKQAGKYMGIEFDSVHDVVFTDDALLLCNNKTGEMSFKKYDNSIYIDTVLCIVTVKFTSDTMYISSNRAVDVEFKKI